jgi:hypothetical protein
VRSPSAATDGSPARKTVSNVIIMEDRTLKGDARGMNVRDRRYCIRYPLTRKDQRVEALGVVRIVKPRIGMGLEFIDVESPYLEVLRRWVEQLSKTR